MNLQVLSRASVTEVVRDVLVVTAVIYMDARARHRAMTVDLLNEANR